MSTSYYLVTFKNDLNVDMYLFNEERQFATRWVSHAEFYATKGDALAVVSRLKKAGFKQEFSVVESSTGS